MPRLIPFDECVARPDKYGERFYLKDHLEGVRKWTHSFFQTNNIQGVECKLIELAAISHDIGKAHDEWQSYITGRTNRGPDHAASGAIFFSYLAYHYLCFHRHWQDHKMLWLQVTRDIADHHGELKTLAKNEEIKAGSFSKMDMDGIQKWIYTQFPIFKEKNLFISASALEEWEYHFEDFVEDIYFDLYLEERKENHSVSKMMDMLQKWKVLTTIIISSDRFDIQSVNDKRIEQNDWNEVKDQIESFCRLGSKRSLGYIRSKAQDDILQQWKDKKDRSCYILEMPTGYGKTVTALKLAVEIGKEKGHSKIVYVAPYLSILEQNSDAIERATKRMPLQHHSLAILNNKTLEENRETDHHSALHMQAWAHDIVCTSFVQWMRAIFPRRAQDTLRRSYLNDAIIIIDEPQIIDAGVWNLFLVGLESVAKLYNLTLIFCSATMPPFYEGLNEKPLRLSIKSRKEDDRYYIQMIEKQTKETCAQKLMEVTEHTAIAILNTIRDAMEVYGELSNEEMMQTYLLHGLMTPIHKAIQINKINHSLQTETERRIRVVSTQIIEAGVDLSFHYMYRALPIIPSLVQAAGRVNRHREFSIGRIETGLFLRDERDTRFIYHAPLRRLSDELLFQKEVWREHELESLVRTFYERMFTENSYEAVLQDIQSAHLGNWPKISRYDVFKSEESHRLPIFIPFRWEENLEWIPKSIRSLFNEFNTDHPEQIYELFINKKLRLSWSFEKNRQFTILFHQFVVNVPVEEALKLVTKEDFFQYRIPKLEDSYSYHSDKGLIMNDDISSTII